MSNTDCVAPTPPRTTPSLLWTMADDQPSTLKSTIDHMLDLYEQIGGLFLLGAVPGGGKSHFTREQLAARAGQGKPTRVLWVVKETLEDNSLGADAAKHFDRLGLPAKVILGERHIQGRGRKNRHRAQFDWSEGPEIKVISQSHLTAMLCAPEESPLGQCLKQATIIVIDEDPTDSLILPGEGWKLKNLASLPRPGRIVQALLCMAESGDWRTEANLIETILRVTTHRWTNSSFWEALHTQLGELSDQDLEDFKGDLLWASRKTAQIDAIEGTLSLGAVAEIVAAFHQDYVSPDPCSQRFNLKWTNEKNGTFNANVLAPWPRIANVIVLDAYADQEQYERVFDAPVVLLRPPQEQPLQIQSAPVLALNEHNVVSGEQKQHLLSVLGEICKHWEARGKPVLLLVSKKVRESPNFKAALREVFADSPDMTEDDLAERVRVQHWQGGRGSNDYYDHDIFALTEVYISEAAREEGLAALAPTDPALRARLYKHKQETEILQMLHRNRQPHIMDDPPTIVVAWEHPEATPYEYRTPFVKRAHQKLWIDLVSELGAESVERLGGFCFDLLLGSCLLKTSRPDPKLDPQIRDWLAGLPEGSLLRQVLLEGRLPAGVHPISRDTALKHLAPIAEHCGLKAHEVAAAPYGLGGAQARRVYLPKSSSSAGMAVRVFEQFVPSTTRTLPRSLEDLI